MSDDSGTTFVHHLQSSDVDSALDGGEFNYTVSIAPGSAKEAHVDWSDTRAVEDKTADADGYLGGGSPDCSVTVQDFCLTEAHEVSTGRWAFNFTIRAQMNSICGTLNTHLAVSDTRG